MTKLRIGLLFGGRSGEHEVSISSARAIARALASDENASKYEVQPFYIQKDGRWLSGTLPQQVLSMAQTYKAVLPLLLTFDQLPLTSNAAPFHSRLHKFCRSSR